MASLRSAPRDLMRGVGYVPRGYRFLRAHPTLWPWALVPAALTATALVVVPWLALNRRAEITAALWPTGERSGFVGALLDIAHGAFSLLTGLVVFVLAVLVAVVGAALLAAPFNDYLSERVEQIAAAIEPPPFRVGALLREAFRALVLSGLRAASFTVLMISGWLLAWVLPGLGHLVQLLISVPLTLAYLSLEQVDFAAARRGWPIARRLGLVRAQPALMLGFGGAVWLCLCVPLLNVMFMPMSVVGGTLLVLDLQRAAPSA